MTEVADLLRTDHKIVSERKYDAGPPVGLEIIEPGEAIATTKEEEWVSKKKTEVINTKQIETRVKRQVVLEDGKVVEDSGPVVTTNTTQDTETQEHHQTELRKLGEDDEDNNHPALKDVDQLDKNSKWVVVPNPDGVVREVKERRVVSREEKEEVKETEDIHHLGDITDEDYLAAVQTGEQDIRRVLRTIDKKSGTVSTGPRLIRDTNKSKKVTDTEETRQLSSIREDGRIVTETERTTEHEELKDDELPHDAPDKDIHLENSQRYFKSRDQEQVDYISNGVKIGEEMRYKGETIEVERHGNGIDEPDFDSLSARARRRNLNRPPRRYRDLLPSASPMDRKDALTRRPLDFDQEEETRKMETSKWLENHFGSESRSSRDSLAEEDEQPPKTSYFNVTIKSQPTAKQEPVSSSGYVKKEGPRLLHEPPTSSSRLQEPERDPPRYYQGISEWSERRHQESNYATERRFSPSREYQRSPVPDYRISPERRISPFRETTPTPPQRKKALERRQRVSQESRYDSGYRTPSRNDTKESREEPLEEPPPDYSPPSPPTMPEKKFQKTRFAAEPTKHKSGNIIGQSIRKLVGKIRSASAERKAKQRAKRSPSPSYQKGHVIDKDINHHEMDRRRTSSPVHRYYLGEDPFGGSIYGRENKYDGVRPVRTSRRLKEEENRSQSTLGRFSKSTGRLVTTSNGSPRVSQTLPRHASKKEDNTINVSIINTQRPIVNGGPAKPARTYKSNLSRSQSFNVQPGDLNTRRVMHKSNPQLNRLDEVPAGLKSPALISSINRSQQNLTENIEESYTTSNRYERNNGYNQDNSNKRLFMKNLKDRAPELFKTLHDNNEDSPVNYNRERRGYDIYEPPTRLRDTTGPSSTSRVIRRGSTSSNDYSETYHTTSRNDDPKNPSITNTVQSFSKKTIPSRDGRSLETIESTEKKSITKSHYVGPSTTNKYYEDRKYTSSPIVIEVRNYRK